LLQGERKARSSIATSEGLSETGKRFPDELRGDSRNISGMLERGLAGQVIRTSLSSRQNEK
jgi:hypothetical protein